MLVGRDVVGLDRRLTFGHGRQATAGLLRRVADVVAARPAFAGDQEDEIVRAMDSLSNFPDFVSAAAPILIVALIAIAAAVWWLKAARRRRGP